MVEDTAKPGKGERKRLCNRMACQRPPALYFNSSTERWYCKPCAMRINFLNDQELCKLIPDDEEPDG